MFGRRLGILAAVCAVFHSGVSRIAMGQNEPIVFSVIGDVPYSASEKNELQEHMDNHNLFSTSEFFAHLGDIKSGSSACVESWYADVAGILKTLAVPTFIVPGDNEWTDCANPAQGWTFWETHFLRLERNYCGSPPVAVQVVRPENFAFVKSGVLFVGINKVGGGGISVEEQTTRLQQDADWVTQQFQTHVSAVRAAVVLAQASPSGSPFVAAFRDAAKAFAKPILYIHGDGHAWLQDRPYPEQNILRVQVERGTLNAPPVQVTVTTAGPDAFLINRDPWPPGSLPFNMRPCVDAGPDLTATVGEETSLYGMATDDGVPLAGNLTVSWTQISGPDIASFEDPSSPATTAFFGTEGVYVLRLTADDGELSASDFVSINVALGDNTAPVAMINAPANGSIFVEGEPVSFTGSASDGEDGNLTALLSWSSDRDGFIGSGGAFVTTTLSVGTHTISAFVTDSRGLFGSDAITVAIEAAPPPGDVVNLASGDFRTARGSFSGTYARTHVLDGVDEALSEGLSGGKPNTRTSVLDHTWTFNVAAGASHAFFVNAFKTVSADGDSFAFYYSKNDVTYTHMLTVSTTTRSSVPQKFVFGENVTGPLYIRVIDTNSTPGNQSLDTLYVDHMYVLSSSGTVDTTPPGRPTDLTATPANASVTLDWSDNPEPDLATYRVYRANAAGGPYTSISSGALAVSAYVDSAVTNGTTYYYYVTAMDQSGNESLGSSPPVPATPSGGVSSGSFHILSIALSTNGSKNVTGVATVTVRDQANQPVSGVVLGGRFTGAFNEVRSGTTGSNGVVTITTSGRVKAPASFTFCVESATHTSMIYDPTQNAVSCASR